MNIRIVKNEFMSCTITKISCWRAKKEEKFAVALEEAKLGGAGDELGCQSSDEGWW